MKYLSCLLATIVCLLQAACGTLIPSQRDWPNSSPLDVEDMNLVLVHSIVCELSYAVTAAIRNERNLAPLRQSRRDYGGYLSGWGVEVATDLTAIERSSLSPSGIWTPPGPMSAVFTLGGSISGSAEATNQNKYNLFYPLSALYKPDFFPPNSDARPCRDPRGLKEGSPLVDIDLKILPLLESRIQVVALGLGDAPDPRKTIVGEKNVLTQTVSIKETLSADITPTWKFTTGSVNSTGRLFSTGRDRTHQVVFTFGPLAPGGRSLSVLAESFHLNEQLRAGLRGSPIFQ